VPSWNRPGVKKVDADYEMPVKAGEVIEATFAGAVLSSGSITRR
jgi:hypothetical protein